MSKLKVETIVNGHVGRIWEFWTHPKHIMHWAFATDDWEAPYAKNDLHVGGKFLTKMSAKDKSVSFDFTGTYTEIIPEEKIEYTIDDGRKVSVIFEKLGSETVRITEEFEPESENTEEKQIEGWQAMLDNFKKYVEAHTRA